MSLCFLCGKWQDPSSVWKKKEHVHEILQHRTPPPPLAPPPKQPCLSLSHILFSRRKGRGPVFLAVICLTSGSVAGQCQVEQRGRIPPAYPELNATPSLHQACHEQSRKSMPANGSCSGRREEVGGKERAEKVIEYSYELSCSVAS